MTKKIRYLERDAQPSHTFRIGSVREHNSKMYGLFIGEQEVGTITLAWAIEAGPHRELEEWKVLDVLEGKTLEDCQKLEQWWRDTQASPPPCEDRGSCLEDFEEPERYDQFYHERRRHEAAKEFWKP